MAKGSLIGSVLIFLLLTQTPAVCFGKDWYGDESRVTLKTLTEAASKIPVVEQKPQIEDKRSERRMRFTADFEREYGRCSETVPSKEKDKQETSS
ncbi:MAG: hypothetical protein K2Q34_03110 [Alphaproteobacteria bacterium]|nr:hypothetical protein [Alphaproteobacteria bacterium]